MYWASGWHCEHAVRAFVPCALIRNKPNTWQRGRLIDRKRLKERCVYSHNCNKAQQSKYVFGKISSEFKNSRNIHFIKIYQLIRLSRLEILNAFSNPNIDIRILGRGYCVAIVSLSLLWNWHWTRWNTKYESEARNWMSWKNLLLLTNSQYFGVILSWGSLLKLIKQWAFIRWAASFWRWASIGSNTVFAVVSFLNMSF